MSFVLNVNSVERLNKSLPTKMVSSFFFLLLISFNPAVYAEVTQTLNAAHTDPVWHKLLHYEKSPFSKSGFGSSIQNSEFFLSPDGKNNPAAELLANVSAFNEALDPTKRDKHAICRFPARFKFIKKFFTLNKDEKFFQECVGYRDWAIDNKINSVSLVFATGYLGNPASYFGHPLLKFNKGSVNGKLLDITLSFAAKTPADENPAVYVLKGLLGGYNGTFSRLQFFVHHTNYTENELRDLWDYELNLTSEESAIIVDHAWELLEVQISYLFLSDNCSFRLSEIIELGSGVKLENPYIFYEIPASLFEGITDLKKPNGDPFTKNLMRIPSRQSRMAEKYLALSKEDRLRMKQLIYDPSSFAESQYTDLSNEQKSKITEALFDYYAFRIADDKLDETFSPRKQQVVLERLKLPRVQVSAQNSIESAVPPHEAQGNFTIRAHAWINDDNYSFQEITFRPALYDVLSLEAARVRDSELKVFETTFRYSKNQLSLRQLDIFSVGTYNAVRVDLPGVSGLSWKIQLGLISQDLICDSCLVAGADLGVGYAIEANQFMSMYGLATLQVQSEKDSYGTVAVTPLLGGFLSLHRAWKAHFKFGTQQFLNAEKDHHQIFEFENRFGTSKHWDVRVSFLQKDERFARVSFSYYL